MTAQECLDELERLRKAAVPRLIEMVQDMSSVIAGMPGMESTPDEILQDFFEATEPEE